MIWQELSYKFTFFIRLMFYKYLLIRYLCSGLYLFLPMAYF
ncbi:hypothetical protein BACCOPRO_03374 [Phocaeicola coprophilus DSM 18228 = JCM 13818]|uniref:Uncharacterized protein n=1 Tax=Phocaeicola coprophilus DSM 18228 = JCM 13818 TaxID=547042 RepID=S0FEL3_9BACT|nr:hypothetical protein BACCOPRO_03374 [Phocaeicola coprophilus DSM 18228 = JCM 13818]